MPHHPLLLVSQQEGVRVFHSSGFNLGSGVMALSIPASMLQLSGCVSREVKARLPHTLRQQSRELGTGVSQHLCFLGNNHPHSHLFLEATSSWLAPPSTPISTLNAPWLLGFMLWLTCISLFALNPKSASSVCQTPCTSQLRCCSP